MAHHLTKSGLHVDMPIPNNMPTGLDQKLLLSGHSECAKDGCLNACLLFEAVITSRSMRRFYKSGLQEKENIVSLA